MSTKLLVVILFTVQCFAETYLVEWTTREPCRDCATVYAVVCLPENPGCGIPTEDIPHVETFKTKHEAIAFLNAGFRREMPPGMSWTITRLPQYYPATFRRLWKAEEVPIVQDVKIEEEPQPEKMKTVVTYREELVKK